MPWMLDTTAFSDLMGELKMTRPRKGLVLDENDLWIAATARQVCATLVTRDTDFRQSELRPRAVAKPARNLA